MTVIQTKSRCTLTECDIMRCHLMVQMVECKFQRGCFAEGYFLQKVSVVMEQ